MLACLLWHEVLERWQALQAGGEPPFPALQQAVDAVFDARIGDISGRGKLAADMREIWLMQPRFDRRTVSSAASLVNQPRFRAGYDFLRLRADVGEVQAELAEWWEDFHLGSDDDREAMLADLRAAQAPRVRRVPKPSAAPGSAPAASAGGVAEGRRDLGHAATAVVAAGLPSAGEAAPPAARKRRRRRRKPAGDGVADDRPVQGADDPGSP